MLGRRPLPHISVRLDIVRDATFTTVNDGDQTMIDNFACAKSLHCRVRHCPEVTDGVESDHTAVRLDLVLTSLKQVNSTALYHGTTDWRKIATDQNTRQRYNDILTEANADSPDMSYEDLNDATKKAGEEIARLVGSRSDDWFQFNIADLAPHIEERNQLLDALRSSADLPPSILGSMRTQLQCLNKNVKDKLLIAKARWAAHVCSKIHDMQTNKQTHELHGNISDFSLAAQLLTTRKR